MLDLNEHWLKNKGAVKIAFGQLGPDAVSFLDLCRTSIEPVQLQPIAVHFLFMALAATCQQCESAAVRVAASRLQSLLID